LNETRGVAGDGQSEPERGGDGGGGVIASNRQSVRVRVERESE
jgi:hypothetical protein